MRYLKVTLLIGFLVSLLLSGLLEAHAFVRLDAMLGSFFGVTAPFWPVREVQYPVFVLLAFGIAWTTIDIGRIPLKAIVAGVAFLQVLISSWILSLFGVFFSPFTGALSVALSFAAGLGYGYTTAGNRKKLIHAMFGERVSTKTFAALVDSDMPLNFEGQVCEGSVLVCEIFNHEELSEALPVADYVAMHNAFLHNASDFLVERGGFLDECDGESLRVIFGTPLPDLKHAATACSAALALVSRLDEVNQECEKIWNQTFDYRIGVNTGEMVVAAYGSKRLGTFSVAGEPVEFARRLCAANTIYGSRVLIGCGTFSLAEQEIEVRPMELIQRYQDARSREEVYELIGLRDALSAEELERRDLFWKGIVYFREQMWDEALGLFYSARGNAGVDGPVEFYIRRIEQLRQGMPALDWTKARL